MNTFARTAELVFDFGDGRVERYRVATNVARGPGGAYQGLRMSEAMRDVLHIPYETRESSVTPGEFVLSSVRDAGSVAGDGAGFLPRTAWTILTATDEQAASGVSFDDILLQARQHIILSYSQDEDQDGLFRDEESLYGCSDQTKESDADATHPDGDGLDDFFEIRTGWTVGPIVDPDLLPSQTTYSVRSSPTSMDEDGDGLTDNLELAQHTDPHKPDTDGDGLSTASRSRRGPPRARAASLRRPDARHERGPPRPAFAELRGPLPPRPRRPPQQGRRRERDLWRRGVSAERRRSLGPFHLVPLVSVYGGFTGVETKRDQRDEDPVFNGCILSGEAINGTLHVVTAEDAQVDESAALDGFMITGGTADAELHGPDQRGGGLVVANGASPTLRRLFFRLNSASDAGGAVWVVGGRPRFEDCLFDQNRCGASACRGGAMLLEDTNAHFVDCRFTDNESGGRGGAVFSFQHGGQENVFERCTFLRNRTTDFGVDHVGTTLYLAGAQHRLLQCRFLRNGNGGGATGEGTVFNSFSRVEISQCLFWGNDADGGAAVASRQLDQPDPSVFESETRFVDCTLAGNVSGAVFLDGFLVSASVENSILWGNGGGQEGAQLHAQNGAHIVEVRTSCIEGLALYSAPDNIGSDPGFASLETGNLRLRAVSPCIDAGNNLLDYELFEPGFQPAPSGDLDGATRTVDGNGDGEAVIDMGAYEFQD